MNFDLGPDERALQDAIREMCARTFDLADIKANGMGGRWPALEEAGVINLRQPEAGGGLGLGMAEAGVVFEELGRWIVPGPIVGTHVGRARGATEATIGLIERAATTIDDLPHLDVVAVMDDEGLWRVAPSELRVSPVEDVLDPYTMRATIESLPKGDRIADRATADALRLEATTLTAAYLVGIATEATDRAVAYAKEREQFGRPIGSFQAVKHLCADAYVRSEVARAAVYAAACTLDDPSVGEPGRAVAGAKVLANEAALSNAQTAIQVFGGMGFTWEVDLHLYLKRAAMLAGSFGTTHAHEAAVAATL